MKQVINAFGRSYKIFFAVAAIMIIQLISAGQFFLCGSVLIGAILCFFWFISSAARLETAAKRNSAQAKKIMLIGLLLRLGMVFVVLGIAAHISTELFLSTSVCFVVFYVTSLGVLIYHGRRR
ncbi:MAG: hypothetical protein IK062_07715 [Selenomonadaceae bacterium]|nr:hypothetical protein [Selenomonadaceae bacterium]